MSDTVEVADPTETLARELPAFSSVEEEAEFWLTHDTSPYWHLMEDITDSPPPGLKRRPPGMPSTALRRPAPDATEELTVRLPADMVVMMRTKARVAGVSLDELIDRWLRDRLDEEFRRAMETVR
jgi:hypothetical protein